MCREVPSLIRGTVVAGRAVPRASAAIRTALEEWARTDAPAKGPGSPAELAARCLHELTGGMSLH